MKKKDIGFATMQSKNNITNVSEAAHDLRGVVAKLHGLHSLLKPKIKPNTEVEQLFSLLEMVCKHGIEITTNILENKALASLNSNEIIFKRYSLNNLIKKQAKVYKIQANAKNIDLIIDIPNHNIFSKINRHSFVQLLDNLVENAIKFTNREGQINIMLREKNEKVILEVRDSGMGIPSKLLDSVFSKKTASKRIGTEGEKSTGMGLSIVKEIVDLHSGKIWVNSIEKEWTSFVIELNCASK